LIEVPDARKCPSQTIKVGDVLLFHAAGGHVRSGDDVIELLGPFVTAVVGNKGDIVTPMGPPSTVLFRARRPGRALVDVVTGDPFHAPRKTKVTISVEA
jgi:hypothetical protein